MAQSGTENQVIALQVGNDHNEDVFSSGNIANGGIEQAGFVEWLWTQDIWVTYLRQVPPLLVVPTSFLSIAFFFTIIDFIAPKFASNTEMLIPYVVSLLGLLALVPVIFFTFYKGKFQCPIHYACLHGLRLWILADLVIEALQCLSFSLLFIYALKPKMLSHLGLIPVGVTLGISVPYVIFIIKICCRYEIVYRDSHRRDNKLTFLRNRFCNTVYGINKLYMNIAEANNIAEEEIAWAVAKEVVNEEEAMKNNKYKEELALISSKFSDVSKRIAEAQTVAARV